MELTLYEPWDSDSNEREDDKPTKLSSIVKCVEYKGTKYNPKADEIFIARENPYSIKKLIKVRKNLIRLLKPLPDDQTEIHHALETLKIKLKIKSKLDGDSLTLKRIKEKEDQHQKLIDKRNKFIDSLRDIEVKRSENFIDKLDGLYITNTASEMVPEITNKITIEQIELVKRILFPDEFEAENDSEYSEQEEKSNFLKNGDDNSLKSVEHTAQEVDQRNTSDDDSMDYKYSIRTEDKRKLYNPSKDIGEYNGPYFSDNILRARSKIIKKFQSKLEYNSTLCRKLNVRFS